MLKKRASGILLHVTSLPSKYGIGDIGPEAYKFVDFLAGSNQSYWQVLPLNHTTSKAAYSPYNCCSAFAGNPLLISPQFLYRDGFLTKEEIKDRPSFSETRLEYGKVAAYKKRLFKFAFSRFKNRIRTEKYERFTAENVFWLEDFATFVSLQHYFGRRSWQGWPRSIRDRKGKHFKAIKEQLKHQIAQQYFLQYVFYRQWSDLKRYCNRCGIGVIGDIPIYVIYDSPDVWAHPEIFKLDRYKRPRYIAGVPPDYFSRTGQLWGNPVYDWEVLKKSRYHWWMERIKHNMKMFDLVRIDHFRGLIDFWQVPASAKGGASKGRWVDGPKDDFFKVLLRHFPNAPIIAEDLGHITAEVREVIEKFNFPSMKVLQFAFDGDASTNPHIPYNHVENCIVYTGTHDNNTIRGWFEKEAKAAQKKRLSEYLGRKITSHQIHWQFVRLAMSSVAKLAIIPVQDILGLSETARMNRPAAKKDNWLWRLQPGRLGATLSRNLRQLTQTYARG